MGVLLCVNPFQRPSQLDEGTVTMLTRHSKEKLNKWCVFPLYLRIQLSHAILGGAAAQGTQFKLAHRPDLRVCVCVCVCVNNPKPCHYRESVVSDDTGRPLDPVRDTTCPDPRNL